MRTPAIAAAVLLLAFTGCGAAQEPAGPEPLTESAAKRMARSMLIGSGDLSFGWDVEPPRKQGKREKGVDCGIRDADDVYDFLALEQSGIFTNALRRGLVQSDAGVLVSEDEARAAMDYMRRVFKMAEARRCIDNALNDAERKHLRFGRPKIVDLPFPRLGDDSFAVRVRVRVRVCGCRTNGYFDLVYLRRSAAVASLFFAQGVRPFARSEERRLARLVDGRMKLALRNAGY